MALTIAIEGKGVIANCDALTNDTGGTGTGDWTSEGGGTMSLTTDVYLYGTSSIAGKYASKSGVQQFNLGVGNELDFSGGGTEEGQYIYFWVNLATFGVLDTLANNGLSVRISSDDPAETNYKDYKIAGSDGSNGWTGGWKLFVIDPTATGTTDTGTCDISAILTMGIWIDTAASVRAESLFIDQIAVGSGLRVTGTSTVGWKDVVDYCTDYTNRAWGMFQEREGIYFSYGKIYIGDSVSQTAIVSFADTGKVLQYGLSEFYNTSLAWVSSYDTAGDQIIIEKHASYATTFENTNCGIAGSTTKPLVIDSTAGTSFDYSGGSIKNGGDLKFALADTLTGVVFDACAEIDTNGATFNIVTIGNTTETVTGSLLVNTQVEGESCTNMKFNTYGANYAIYVAATVTTFDMDNWIFDDTNNTTGYALYWLGTTGTLTVNALNGTNLVTAGCLANTGGAVEVVANPVAITLTVTDIGTTLPINGARALVAVANGDNFPFEETVTATSSSLTATVAHTAHGYSTGQKVLILGANEQAYNGVQLITVTGVDAYTFTLLETTTTPATGTLNATTVLIDGTTNASGIISDTRSYGANQLIQGRVRMSTSSPYYKTSPLTGTIDSTNGLGIAVQMIRDE